MAHGRGVRNRGRARRLADAALKPELYFAYGSNLDVVQMRERCPTSRPTFRARLRAYRLDFTHFSATRWQGGTADVVPDPAEQVFGLVYEMGEGDFARLDRFETAYERVRLSVEDDTGGLHGVTSYAVREKGLFRPHEIYLRVILDAALRLDLPAEYIARLRARYEGS